MSNMNSISAVELARRTANIENAFNSQLGYDANSTGVGIGGKIKTPDGMEFEVLAEMNYNRTDTDAYQKGVMLRDDEGNIYVHFNGTGDGNWNQNSAAYGVEPDPSDMQQECLKWFDKEYERLKSENVIKDDTNLYTTGHSQGANNAMFVTMRSKHAHDIDACIPLDGPGFSDKFVRDTKELRGDEYDDYCNKIWAFNGEHDFVSPLGQNSIVPEGRTKYIPYSRDTHDIMNYHAATGLVDENGQFVGELLDDDSSFRKKIKNALSKVTDFPSEKQAAAATTIMTICENYIGGGNEWRTDEFNIEDFEVTKEVLPDVIIAFCEDNPDELKEILKNLTGIDASTADTIVGVIKGFNGIPEVERRELITEVLGLLTIENNQITIDMTKLYDVYNVFNEILEKNLIHDPEAMADLLKAVGIKDNTIHFLAQAIVIIGWDKLNNYIGKYVFIIDCIFTVLAYFDLDDDALNLIVGLIGLICDAVDAIKNWYNENFNAGYKYSKENPYINVDTDEMFRLAGRLTALKYRIENLSSSIKSLYWQVGLLDLWDVVYSSNALIWETYKLKDAANYLSIAADRFSTADYEAKNDLGE